MARVAAISQAMFGSIIILLLLLIFKVEAQTQPPGRLLQDEVEALKEVATELGKKGWNFEQNPCGNDVSWVTPPSNYNPLYGNTVLCNCSITASQCHVESIYLRGQNLAGVAASCYCQTTLPQETGSYSELP